MPLVPNLSHPLCPDYWWLVDPDLAAGNTWFDLMRNRNGGLANATFTGVGQNPQPPWSSISPPGGRGSWSFIMTDSTKETYGNISTFPISPPFSVAALVNSTVAATAQVIFCKQYNGGIVVPVVLCLGNSPTHAYDGIAFFNGGWHSSGVTRNIVADNIWHFVVGTFDQSVLKYYVDGKLDASAAFSGTYLDATTTIAIGRYNNDHAGINGNINSTLFYRRALSSTEVFQLYTESLNGYSNLLWRPNKRKYFSLSSSQISKIFGTSIPQPIFRSPILSV